MYINKTQPIKQVLQFTFTTMLLLAIWSSVVVVFFQVLDFKFLTIPFLPISLVGTALSFYLGFKNNASYDRVWEARKNWGGIVNNSRTWSTMLNSYLSINKETLNDSSEIQKIKRDLTNRHIAWLYAHKFYLRHKHQPWEHRGKINNDFREMYQKDFNIATELDSDLSRYLDKEEIDRLKSTANPAAQILNNQAKALHHLHEKGTIELFRLIEFQNHIGKLFEDQGKNERIKNFPYPRQYSMMVSLSITIFCLLLPFGLLAEMNKQGDLFIWLTIPFSILVSLIFYYMYITSEYSENPFEGLIYDVPITNITRNIEIDMLQMIDIKDTPKPIEPKNGVLM